ncbi:MAG: hypothetical protein Q8932_08930 [Bacteroidota bacterium]|nr:hypothetical protein [Bacteroidota bacterium]
MKKILLAVMSAVLLSTSPLQAAYDQQVFMRGVRPMGMGGAFVALSDDQNAIFYNPAGLTQRQGSQFTLIELPLNISDDVLQFYNFYNDNKDSLKDFDNLSDDRKIDLLNQINDNVIKYRPNLRLGLPNTSFLSGAGFISWGFGIFNQEDIGFKFNRSLIVPSISFWGNADAVAAVPLAHRFDALPFVPGKLSVGTTLKYIARAKIEELNKSVLEFEDFAPQLQYGKGFGFDLGTIYQPSDRWNVGMQVTDVGGTKMTYEAIETSEKGKVNKPSYNGACPVALSFTATVHYSGKGMIRYTWVNSDGGSNGTLSKQLSGTGTDVLPSHVWQLGRSLSGSASLKILSPVQVQSTPANFVVNCGAARGTGGK